MKFSEPAGTVLAMAFADRLPINFPRLPRLDGRRNLLRDLWNLLSGMPAGKAVFSRLVGRLAPYTGTIHATVTVLRAGYAEVQMPDRRSVRNHLDSVHAIALANLAELAGNVALMYSLPDDARFIVSGMDIEYMKKARGTITAVGEPPVPRTSARARYDVPVTLRDAAGDEVARAVLHSLVGPKPGSPGAASDRGDVN
jgi:uncharacterized protein (TIGR00369 family)